ncbi:SAC3 family protein A-like isoform X1 [Cynara cardunculus var. scolymus]|uniref:SAC3 family protein A-like isoform X1 n=1 Tax=Cynara cardunculus var. scolymus TaxID=59895 RepID=UPI000D62D1B9|nr:SAC3 family protein A-like isoform X1 [Cynara cardunculus var. scolymus]
MNQGVTDTITTLDPNSLEHHAVDSSHGQAPSSYPPSTSSESASWTMYGAVNEATGSKTYPSTSFNHDQHSEPHPRNIQDGETAASAGTVSSSGTASLEYANYAAYPNSDPYGYGSTGYAGYYSSYQQQPTQSYPQQQPTQSYPQQQPTQSYPQQQPTQSYPQQQANQSYAQQQPNQTYAQPAGAYQSTGAPHQPISSFQNTGSYAGPASYSTTYYNPGDYQTSGGYPSANYNSQTNSWNQGSYASYGHQYPNYSAESNMAYSAQNAPAAPLQYQPDYKQQWTDYYSQTEVTCAPGTENLSSTSASNLVSPLPAVASGYSALSSQHLPSTAPSSWRPEPGLSELSSVQPSAAINNVQEGYWKHGGQGLQNYHVSSAQSNFQKPLDSNPIPGSFQDQRKPEVPQRPIVQYSASHQVAQTYQSSPQTAIPFDSGRVSKMQIPTNPRISSNLPVSLPKNDNAAIGGVTKPAYISVSLPKTNENASSHVAADSAFKPGMLPKSLRGYVERALARCKDDRQMAACQDVLKEVITKASTDGTLCTLDWDTEPLFPLPNTNAINNDTLNNSIPPSSPMKNRRSPSRRTKSRWEPLPEEKPVDKQASFTPNSVKYSGGIQNHERDKQFPTGQPENKDNKFSHLKFYISNQKETNKAVFRPAKRQHIGDGRSGSNNGDSSSDSDKEQSLTAYYAGAITLADSPEERKRRESRSKRFEKTHGNRAAYNPTRTKNVGAGNLYTRRASASVLANSNSSSDGASRAVEDIDWDSLTVKGTCQEIEKRYLRLTSAPDPATVRPEEVLEKALLLVQDSQKNYLYKCDQLKSIRQDLTVQRIRNELTVKVYETHARLAIEVGDLSEINQCQSQLQTLYAEGIKGCHMEFSAYNLLCVILHSNNNRDLLSAMSRLSIEARKDAAVKHALAVRAAVTSGNYVSFFRLYKIAPNLNTCLMDLYIEKMRYAALKCITRSYRPTLPVSYVAQVLGFPSAEVSDEKDTGGLEECTEWLKAHGACLATDNTGEMMLDAKASMASLFMPEPDDAVAHGDASLAVNDFLTRSLS